MGWYDKDCSKGDEDVYQRVIMLIGNGILYWKVRKIRIQRR